MKKILFETHHLYYLPNFLPIINSLKSRGGYKIFMSMPQYMQDRERNLFYKQRCTKCCECRKMWRRYRRRQRRKQEEDEEIEERRARGRKTPANSQGRHDDPRARVTEVLKNSDLSEDQIKEALKKAISIVKERKANGQEK